MDLLGLYVGIVEKNNDPEKLGRLKVRVPHVYGITGSIVGAIPMDEVPWAIPLGLPAGGSPASGGMDWLPEAGDQVCVQFLDGEPEKPVWSWLMQTQTQAQQFNLHLYDENTGGKPKRGALTRYGHTLEWNAGSLTLSTSKGYQVFLLDGDALDGQIMLRTPAGQLFKIDDETKDATLFLIDDFYIQLGGELNILCDEIRLETLTGGLTGILADQLDLSVTGEVTLTGLSSVNLSAGTDMTLTSEANLTLSSASAMTLGYGSLLNLGADSTEPFVLGTQLSLLLNSLMAWLSTHTHTSAAPGTPTSPPQVTPYNVVGPPVAQLVSTTIFGK